MTYSDPYSTAWERVNLDGTLTADVHLIGDSASHAGATGATSALLDYVVGVTSLRPAITSGRSSPTREGLDELKWAQGAAHSYGAIASRWGWETTRSDLSSKRSRVRRVTSRCQSWDSQAPSTWTGGDLERNHGRQRPPPPHRATVMYLQEQPIPHLGVGRLTRRSAAPESRESAECQ